jgi:hypothetical protein
MFVTFQQVSTGANGRAIALNATQVTDIAPSPSGGTYVNVVGHEYVIEVREPFSDALAMLNGAYERRG